MKEKGDYYKLTKIEVKRLLNIIKGYYNSQFFVDEYVIQAWEIELEPYDMEDSEQRLKEYLKEFPDIPPKPHTFIKNMLTHEQKQKHEDYIVGCQLCGKWLPLSEYDKHYGRCLDIEYLLGVAREKGLDFTREDLEQYNQDTLNRLYEKYKPTGVWSPCSMK